MATGLPDANQTWSHGTCSIEDLKNALDDASVTAIESDILIGECLHDIRAKVQPIAAHPPDRTSNLTMEYLFDLVTKTNSLSIDYNQARKLRRHLKLDFKELAAVEPTLLLLKNLEPLQSDGKAIFLNADILPGPGKRWDGPKIEANSFLKACGLTRLDDEKKMKSTRADSIERQQFAYSLGFAVDCRSLYPYTKEDVLKMVDLVNEYDMVPRTQGVVLAINARVLVRDCSPFEIFLEKFPTSQMLVWVGTGEPPISRRKIQQIESHFRKHGSLPRVGFDCVVS